MRRTNLLAGSVALMSTIAPGTQASPWHRPAEWARHSRTIVAWPGSNTVYAREDPRDLAGATRDVSSIAEAIARFEPVDLLVSKNRVSEARRRFAKVSQPHEITIRSVDGEDIDLWMRDIAPTFTFNRGASTACDAKQALEGVDFNFNGWGGRFPGKTTTGLASTILTNMNTTRIKSSIVTEGGAIEIDGQGTLITTESSLINDNRNPGKTKEDIEAELRRTLGVTKFIWIPGLKGGDTTDCHIDALVRFVRPGTVLLSKPVAGGDAPWQRVYDEARAILETATDARGQRLEIMDVAEPDPYKMGLDRDTLADSEEDPPALNYVNYLVVNGGIIAPRFGDRKADAAALKTLRQVYGDERTVVAVDLHTLPFLGGGIHCATQEVPLFG